MVASSVTGTGQGSSAKPTSRELAILSNGPSILVSGIAESEDVGGGTYQGTVVFPTPLPGVSDNPGGEYCVLLTTINSTWATVVDLDDHDLNNDNVDDHFVGFSFETEDACSVMYMVCKMGVKPQVIT